MVLKGCMDIFDLLPKYRKSYAFIFVSNIF